MKKYIDYVEIRNLLTIRYNHEEKVLEKNIPKFLPIYNENSKKTCLKNY